MTDTEYTMLRNADDAVAAHREQQFVGALISSIQKEAEAKALDALRRAMPTRATAIGAESFQVNQALAFQSKRANGLRSLAGMTDDTIQWDAVASTIGNLLGQEEEVLVRAEDEYRNATAYNVDPNDAQFQYERAKARVDAFRAAYNDTKAKGASDEPVADVAEPHRRHSKPPDKAEAS